LDSFDGDWYHTGQWPHEGVDFTGKRVGFIGTGSTGIQAIPQIAKHASHLYVFQRTPNFSMPAYNAPLAPETQAEIKADYRHRRQLSRESASGLPSTHPDVAPKESALSVSDEERTRRYEEGWRRGGAAGVTFAFNDIATNIEANTTAAEFVRGKITELVRDPEVAQRLMPHDHPIGTKRICVDTEYYETYNRDNVTLVDVRANPIQALTPAGLRTNADEFELDSIVFAIGFDAMTGALNEIDIQGRDGVVLKDKWSEGPRTYLGLAVVGFPNMFTITGPGSPSVLSNMVVSIEQHVDWIAACLQRLSEDGLDTIEARQDAEDEWVEHVNDVANATLYPQTNSWYMGANIPGKPRIFMPYVGGVGNYRRHCDDIAADDYRGFERGSARVPLNAYKNWRITMALDEATTAFLVEAAASGLPPIHEMDTEQARGMGGRLMPLYGDAPGVRHVERVTIDAYDGGQFGARVLVPNDDPRGLLVYYHGGGWVIGALDDFDHLGRHLAERTGCVVVLVDYRLAPEYRYPTAAEDAWSALLWANEARPELAGTDAPLLVAGDSAGGNLSAIVAQRARAEGGPLIALQVLVYPVTDSDLETASYVDPENQLMLSRETMIWFWDHYVPDPDQRLNADASPLRAEDLSGLPPAVVLTAEHDVLRDEGEAYAQRLEEAGVPVRKRRFPGQMHGFFTMVNVLPGHTAGLDYVVTTIDEQLAELRAPA
jgi:acetyl esterase/lipase/cation diffusion facilitator CzcD-associated flavoprotein CzcO